MYKRQEIYALKAYPHISLKDSSISRALYMDCAQNQLRAMSEIELERIKRMDAYIGISVTDNTYEMSDVPAQNMEMANKMMKEALSYRVDHTKWVILRFPNGSMAQAAKMSKEAFENYYYDVCTLDYAKMANAMKALVALMEKCDKVRIKGKGTDLAFSIKGIPAIPCAGEMNIPDGEIFTAPVKNSINGVLSLIHIYSLLCNAFIKSVSEANGPLICMPSDAAFFIAGAKISISSLPQVPLSPA